MHGGNSAVTSRELSQWVNQYNDITVTGKTNFNNDISISYNSLNYLNVSIDSEANITLDITNSYNNNCSEFIFNNKIKANNGLTIKGDTIIGEDIDDLLIINSTIYSNSNLITGSNLTNNMNITGDCIIGEDLSNILVVNSTSEFINNTSFKKNVTIQENTKIEGDLTIIGNLSYSTQTQAPQISAPITGLNTDSNTIANTYDSGMLIVRTSPNLNAFIGWDESEGKFIMGTGNISPNDTSSDLSITTGDLQIANIISTGSFTTTSGNITTSSGNITTTNGNFTTTSGNFTTSSGNFTTTSGNFTTTSGNFTTTSGKIGIGVTNPNDKLEVSGNINLNSTTSNSNQFIGFGISPVGSITMYGGQTAPSGWHLCNGTALNRTTYSSLFNIIGTIYGAGNGSTTFLLPNMNGRFVVGVGTITDSSTQGNFTATYNLGGKDGTQKHILTENELPSHSHTFYAKRQSSPQAGSNSHDNPRTGTSGDGYNGQITTDATGGGQEHENRPPYITLNYIIRII